MCANQASIFATNSKKPKFMELSFINFQLIYWLLKLETILYSLRKWVEISWQTFSYFWVVDQQYRQFYLLFYAQIIRVQAFFICLTVFDTFRDQIQFYALGRLALSSQDTIEQFERCPHCPCPRWGIYRQWESRIYFEIYLPPNYQ